MIFLKLQCYCQHLVLVLKMLCLFAFCAFTILVLPFTVIYCFLFPIHFIHWTLIYLQKWGICSSIRAHVDSPSTILIPLECSLNSPVAKAGIASQLLLILEIFFSFLESSFWLSLLLSMTLGKGVLLGLYCNPNMEQNLCLIPPNTAETGYDFLHRTTKSLF